MAEQRFVAAHVMAPSRDLVALSAIFVAPLAAILASQAFLTAPAPEAIAPREVDLAPEVIAPREVTLEPLIPEAPAPEVPAPAPEPVDGRDPNQAMLMHGDALVVHTAPEPAWAEGRAAIKAKPGHLLTSKPAPWDRITGPARALDGATVVVYAGDGSACVATVGAARLQHEETGDIYPETTDPEVDYGTFQPPASKAVLRDMVNKIFTRAGYGNLLLLAEQRGHDNKPCRGVWARRADLPAPAVFGRRPTGEAQAAALAAEVLPLVRAQPELAALAQEYAEWLTGFTPEAAAEEATWEQFVAANLQVTRWDEVGGPREVLAVELRALDREPCSYQFSGGVALLLERRADGLVRLDQPGWFDLAALADIDRDGVLEGVTSTFDATQLEAAGAGADALADSFQIPFTGCPC
jgi:hypothetical protein